MPNMEKLQSFKVICEGGLDSNQNYLSLSERTPGSATTLVNFEPSLFGGYRRVNGFAPLESAANEVDAAGAEGAILGIAIWDEKVIAMRKQQASATYKFYRWVPAAAWSAYTPGFSPVSTGVTKIRYDTFNFAGVNSVAFVDGVNKGMIFDGTNWGRIDPAGTGANYANAGGPMAVAAPKYTSVFKNTVFVAGDATVPQVIAYSAPNKEYDWTAASGAGQINVGFKVKQIKPFRDELYVFGDTKIRKIVVDGTNFVIQDVTWNIGLVAEDGVQEINGDLLFLSQDGLRTIAGTNRIGDVELAVQSKNIQQDLTDLITTSDLPSVTSVVVRRKSQIRYFFSSSLVTAANTNGIIGGLKGSENGVSWEWGKLLGIRTSVCTSGYILTQEYVLHGDYNGKVYRQETGNNFDGSNIPAVYTTPYLDFGESQVRKTLHKISVFLRAEGETAIGTALQYDWNDLNVFNPSTYTLVGSVSGSVYGSAIYGTSSYATSVAPVLISNVEGSGFSNRITFATNDTNAPYSIQGIVYEYAVDGRK